MGSVGSGSSSSKYTRPPSFGEGEAGIPENSPVFKKWQREHDTQVGIPENSPVFKKWQREQDTQAGINPPAKRKPDVSIDPIEGGLPRRPRCPEHPPVNVKPIDDTPISIDPIETPVGIYPIIGRPIDDTPVGIYPIIGRPIDDTPISIDPIENEPIFSVDPIYPFPNGLLEITQDLSGLLDALPDDLAEQILSALPTWMRELVTKAKTQTQTQAQAKIQIQAEEE